MELKKLKEEKCKYDSHPNHWGKMVEGTAYRILRPSFTHTLLMALVTQNSKCITGHYKKKQLNNMILKGNLKTQNPPEWSPP